MNEIRKCRNPECQVILTPENCNVKAWKHNIFICRKCDSAQHKAKQAANPEKYNSYFKNYRDTHKDKIKLENQKYNNSGKRIEQARITKLTVLTHYSNEDYPCCCGCGFDDIRALSIDHMSGGGSKHRKEMPGGHRFYRWLMANGYPEGYQVLCMNCQFIKRVENNECKNRSMMQGPKVIPVAV